jgi:hypothetical protein
MHTYINYNNHNGKCTSCMCAWQIFRITVIEAQASHIPEASRTPPLTLSLSLGLCGPCCTTTHQKCNLCAMGSPGLGTRARKVVQINWNQATHVPEASKMPPTDTKSDPARWGPCCTRTRLAQNVCTTSAAGLVRLRACEGS